MAKKDDIIWITKNGKHIPIKSTEIADKLRDRRKEEEKREADVLNESERIKDERIRTKHLSTKMEINYFFKRKLPKWMNTLYAKKVVTAYEAGEMGEIHTDGVEHWVTEYNGLYDKGLAEEARKIVQYWKKHRDDK